MDSALISFRKVIVAIAAPLLALGCTDGKEQEPANEPVPENVVESPPPVLPTPQAPLDRERLIIAALRAATAAALGQDDSAAQAELKGRRFELRIRFGCTAAPSQGASGWSYDEEQGVLRARVRADVDADEVKASDLVKGDYEGAIGFTLRRPWLLVDGCPDPKFAPMADGPAISLVQLFTNSDSRVQRPESSYEAVAQVKPEERPTQGLNLVVSGRIEPLPDGRAIRCAATEGPPACIVSAIIDSVAIEDPARQVRLGAWGSS